jgi:ArsR family transcriptional regulator
MEEQDVVRALAALAHGLRLQVFRALVVVGPQGMTPGTMSEHLGVAPATLSFHLKELAHAGLVTQQRDGRFLVYRAAYERMNALLGYLTANCCAGQGCLVEVPQGTPASACSSC